MEQNQSSAAKRSLDYFSAVQCSEVQGSAVRYSAERCSEVYCITVQCSAVQGRAEKWNAVQCSAVQCSVTECSAVQWCAVLWSDLQSYAVQCSVTKYSAVECSAVEGGSSSLSVCQWVSLPGEAIEGSWSLYCQEFLSTFISLQIWNLSYISQLKQFIHRTALLLSGFIMNNAYFLPLGYSKLSPSSLL